MHIVVGEVSFNTNKSSNKYSATIDDKMACFKERRKKKHDRRKSVRNGILVSFSFKNNRRVLRDRRKVI